MKKTNKILSAVVAVAIASSTTNASEVKASTKDYFTLTKGSYKFDTPVYALESETVSGIDTVSKNTKFDKLDYSGINIGRIVQKESGLVLGSSANFFGAGQGSWGVGIDLRVGYAPMDDLSIYALGGYNLMFLSDYTVAKGTNVGLGVTYDISESFAFVTEYKTHTLTVSTDNRADVSAKAKGLSVGLAFSF